jgi:hypothetical protein
VLLIKDLGKATAELPHSKWAMPRAWIERRGKPLPYRKFKLQSSHGVTESLSFGEPRSYRAFGLRQATEFTGRWQEPEKLLP